MGYDNGDRTRGKKGRLPVCGVVPSSLSMRVDRPCGEKGRRIGAIRGGGSSFWLREKTGFHSRYSPYVFLFSF